MPTPGTNYFTRYTSTVDVALTDKFGNATLISCTAGNLPTDAGYAKGCIAIATDSGILYTNTGSTTVASFTAVDSSDSLTLPSAFVDASTDTGVSLSLTADAITTGEIIKAINGNTTNFTTGAALFYGDMGDATAGNGLVIIGTGAYEGTGLAHLSTGAMTTGVGLQVTSTTGLTSGSLIRVTTSTAGALATNGAVSITGTGAFTSTSNVGLLDVLASATTQGTVVHFRSTAAGQTSSQILNITASGYTTGYTGNVVQITGCSTTGASNTLAVIGVNTTAGNTVSIANNALTVGTGTLLNVSHTTSVIGAGSSLVRISSTGVDTGTTTGTLLDLSSSSAAGATLAMLTDSSADTAARIGLLLKVTNVAAVGAIPLKTSNVAVVEGKFTKILSHTDGTKTVTIWLSQDNTDPDGVLTGLKGDICLNSVGGSVAFCEGDGTDWTTLS